MKRLMFLFCLIMATTTATQAQHNDAPPLDVAAPISVSDYNNKVKELNKLLDKGDATAAENTFADIQNIVNAELKVVRYKMRDAANKEEVTKYSELTQKQRTLYANILAQKRNNMVTNKTEVIQKLKELGGLFI